MPVRNSSELGSSASDGGVTVLDVPSPRPTYCSIHCQLVSMGSAPHERPVETYVATPAAGPLTSSALGWVSTLAWSISFYPQAILNYRRRSVDGLSLDFVYLNVQGFLAYSVYNIALFSSSGIRKEYRERNHGHSPSVRGNDVAFAAHAFVLSAITLIQTFTYKRGAKQVVSAQASFFIAVTSTLVAILLVTASFGSVAWLDLLYYLSYLKIAISSLKLIPQAVLNYKRKSTIGWSIHNILLDLTGGVCSLAQLLLDASINDDWGSLRGNPAKLILGLIAISFDGIFLLQHYILYRHSNGKADEPEAEDAGEPDERTRLVR